MDPVHSRSESNKSNPNPNPNLNKALPPLPLELEFNQSPLRLVSHSGSFETITSSATPTPLIRIGTRTGLPAQTRPPPPASARPQSRPQPWKSRAATDNTFDFALEDLFDPDSPLQAKNARNTADRMITSTSESAARVSLREPETEPEPVNQLSRSLPRPLSSMKELETGTYRDHASNSVDMDIEDLITDDDDNTNVVGIERQIDQMKPLSLVDHYHDQPQAQPKPHSSPLPILVSGATTKPPIIPTTAVEKIHNRLDIEMEHLDSKPSQSTTPPASSSTSQQPAKLDTDIDFDTVPITPSARDGRLSFGPGLSEDDLQRNARVLASLARRVKKRVSN